ncbi:hypothetical protein [Bacillus sp. AK128]
MIVSAILILPDAVFFSGYPLFVWVILVPFVPLLLAFIFYRQSHGEQNVH